MRAISLRGVDEEIARKLKAEAAQRGTSVNALILQLIRAGIGIKAPATKRHEYHDLDQLAGTWTEEDAAEFARTVSDFEQVDKELWGEADSSGH